MIKLFTFTNLEIPQAQLSAPLFYPDFIQVVCHHFQKEIVTQCSLTLKMFCARQESKAQSNILSHHHVILYHHYWVSLSAIHPLALSFTAVLPPISLIRGPSPASHLSSFSDSSSPPAPSLKLMLHMLNSACNCTYTQCLLCPFLCYWCAIPNANIIDYGVQLIHIFPSGPASPWMSTNMSSLLTEKNRINRAGRFLQMSKDSPVYLWCPVSCVNYFSGWMTFSGITCKCDLIFLSGKFESQTYPPIEFVLTTARGGCWSQS